MAAFAPFALYGPALGIPTALPDVDVTKPGELTADALDAACARIGATLAFASPAALANVVATARPGRPLRRPRGAAGGVLRRRTGSQSETLRAVAALAPNATLHTPYGMTEVLPVADIELAAIVAGRSSTIPTGGVCVGRPVIGAEVRIAALGFDPEELPAGLDTGTTGEILVRAPWVSDGYLGLWATQRAARPGASVTWHRSGDVGHLDADGRLWVEGRAVHVIHGVDGPITLGAGRAARWSERSACHAVAAVGVGPVGSQQLVVVVEDPGVADGPAKRRGRRRGALGGRPPGRRPC